MNRHVHSQPFRFYYTRGTASAVEFFPHAGTKLAFQNRGVDTLQIKHPSVELQGGDAIKVTYKPTASSTAVTVFQGTVEQITETALGGSDAWQDVLVASPWSKMDRLVFQQYWSTSGVWSSNTILNQSDSGSAIGFKAQLNEIFTFAKTRCGVTAAALSGGQKLPADEVRDLTCAQAVNRVLRWFPKKTVRLDYSGATPALELVDTTTPASWAASIDKSSIVRTYNAHPITGVYLETVTTGVNDGAPYRILGSQKYPSTVQADAVDVLHATVMLEGSSSSNTYESMKTNCQEAASFTNVNWWINKHPRLARYLNDRGKVSLVGNAAREDNADDYPSLTDASVEELTKYGLRARLEKFTAHVKITDDDDVEEDIILQMKFVTSNAVDGKVYRRMVGSSSISSETIPAGLAQAIYEDRSGSLQTLECDVRLGSTFPKIGETYQGLILQSFGVDVADLTASCRFGQPDHLSPDDMAGIMTGFRNRTRCAASWNRDSGEASDDDDNPIHVISPVEATEFCPGIKSKTTIKSSSGGGSIKLDSTEVDSGEEIAVREITVKGEDGEEKTVKVLASESFDPGSGGDCVTSLNGETGDMSVVGGESISVTTDGKTIVIGYVEGKKPDPYGDPCEHPEGGFGVPLDLGGGGVGGGGGGGFGGGVSLDDETTHGEPCNDCN